MCYNISEALGFNYRKTVNMMYQVKDRILYGTHGVCEIVAMEEKEFMGAKKEYYVLKPFSDDAATLFVPVGSEKAESKMRRLLTEEEIHELIRNMPYEEANWINNENERKEKYRKIIAGGDRTELIQMIKALYYHKQKREEKGKRLYISDERFFHEAERLLYEEFQYVLNIKRDELMPMIFEEIQKSQE